MKKMNYRIDITGLRGLAVLAILIFHLDLGLVSGGFIGVDIFFVISGYLISKIIYIEIQSNSFSLLNFYERRARRILPALISTLLFSYLVFYLGFFPEEFIGYAKSLIASALFSANLYFFSTLGYFSPAATEIPLLHLWSLGVEEQFYILFPLFMMLLAPKSRRFLSAAIFSLIVLSLLSSQWMLTKHPTASFYLLPFRAFELLMGGFIAIAALPKLSGKLAMFMSSIGFIFILYPLFLFNKEMAFPGFSAFVPCLGTALLIWSGEESPNVVNRILTLKPLLFLGEISYSLYLVHWPIIVFAKRFFSEASVLSYSTSALVFCFLFAYLNYRFVEQPFRNHKPFRPQKVLIYSVVAIVSVSLGASGGLVIKKKHRNQRIAKILNYLTYDPKPAFLNGTCFLDYDLAPDEADISNCLPKGPHDKTVMIWGDSHGAHLYAGLKENLETRGYSLGMLSASACAPIMGVDVAGRPHCRRFNDLALETILKVKPRTLILAAFWPIDDEKLMNLFEETIHKLAKEDIKLVILGLDPFYKMSVPLLIAEQIKNSKIIKAKKDMFMIDPAITEEKMQKRFGSRQDIRYISVINNICNEQGCPLITEDGTPVHFDVSHLTVAGSKLFAKKLGPLIIG